MAGRPTNDPDNYFAIGRQSAKGTEATTFHFLKHLDGTGLDIEHEVQSEREGGDGQDVGLRYKSRTSMDGAMNVNARPEVAARVFHWGIGPASQSAVPAGSAGASQCQIVTSVPTSGVHYLTAEQRFADTIDRQTDARFSEITVSGEAGRPLKIETTLVGGGTNYQRDTASALTPTREQLQPFFFPFGSYVIDGAGNTAITKFRAKLSRNNDLDVQTTGIARDDVIPLTQDSDLEFTLKYEDRTLYNKVHYGGGSQIPVALSTGAFKAVSEFGTGTAYRFIEINFPLFTYGNAKVNKLDPDGKTMYVDVVAGGLKTATHSFYTRVQVASQAAI